MRKVKEAAINAYKLRREVGKPRTGVLYDTMIEARKQF